MLARQRLVQSWNLLQSGSFPVQPPTSLAAGGFAITWGLNDHLKTPYSHVLNFSLNRELPSNFVFEAAYVGRFAHRLLQEEDIAMPLNLYDPKSGMNYFQAATALAKQYRAGVGIQNVQPIPYWEDMFPGAAGPCSADWRIVLWIRCAVFRNGPHECHGNPGNVRSVLHLRRERNDGIGSGGCAGSYHGKLLSGVQFVQRRERLRILQSTILVALRMVQQREQRLQLRTVQLAPSHGAWLGI